MVDSRDTNDDITTWQFTKFVLVCGLSAVLYQRLVNAVAVFSMPKQMLILSITAFIGLGLVVRLVSRIYGHEPKVSGLKGVSYLIIAAVGIAALELSLKYTERFVPVLVLLDLAGAIVVVVLLVKWVRRRRSSATRDE